MTIVYKYRVFCETESAWVYTYGISAPTACVNNTSHTINTASISLIDTISTDSVTIINNYTDSLQSSRIVEQSSVIELKSFHGITSESKINVTGTGSVSSTVGTDSEIKLSINGTTDIAGIRSQKRGFYVAGLVSEVGIAVRIPSPLVTGNILKFGYFDDNNGYYFKLTGSTLNAGIMSGGSENLIASSSFNKYKLDGTESNGITLDLTKGNIFRIDFTWYGFGQIVFGVIQTDNVNDQKFYPMHVYTSTTSTTCKNPCLPINVQLSSNGSSTSKDVYVAGRQYSILGNIPDDQKRNMYVLQGASSLNTNTNRLFSLRFRSSYKTLCNVTFKKIYALANAEILLQVHKNATLSGSSFADITQVEESCLQVDTSSSFSGGTLLKSYLLFPNTAAYLDIQNLDLYEDDTITFTWKSGDITNSIDLTVEWDERW